MQDRQRAQLIAQDRPGRRAADGQRAQDRRPDLSAAADRRPFFLFCGIFCAGQRPGRAR